VTSFIHYGAAAAAILAFICFAVFGVASHQMLDPNLDWASRLTVWFFSLSARQSDYIGRGWRYHKLQWACLGLCLVAIVVWGLTAS
jgi:peptidoglycan/LPS O-acetylase OafA/YrhL